MNLAHSRGSFILLDGFQSGKRLSRESLKSFSSLFDPVLNSFYDSFVLGQVVMKMRMDEASAERQLRLSPDVVLRRLQEVVEENAQRELKKFNEQFLEVLFSLRI